MTPEIVEDDGVTPVHDVPEQWFFPGARLHELSDDGMCWCGPEIRAHPPTGWCPECRCYVGAYISNGGGYFGTQDLRLAVSR